MACVPFSCSYNVQLKDALKSMLDFMTCDLRVCVSKKKKSPTNEGGGAESKNSLQIYNNLSLLDSNRGRDDSDVETEPLLCWSPTEDAKNIASNSL